MIAYDENIHYFITSGSRTKAYPLAANIDSATALSTDPAYNDANLFWPAGCDPRLLSIVCLTATPTAGSIVIVDVTAAGNAVLTIPIAADASNKIVEFPEGGIKMPENGFGVTTVTSSYMFIFTYTRAP